jgi:type II secretory pathway pseudopilin PulG
MLKRRYQNFLTVEGQAIIEIILSLAIMAIFISGLPGLLIGSYQSLTRGSQTLRAQMIAQEGIEAVRSIRDRAWAELRFSRSAIAIDNNRWVLTGEGTTEQLGDFTRLIDFFPVFRDSGNNIVPAVDSEATMDADSKEVKVTVSWEIFPGQDREVVFDTLLINRDYGEEE